MRSSGHSSKFSLPNLLERDAVRLARERERERERSASSDVLLSTSPAVSTTMLSSGGSVTDQPPSGAEDDGMDPGEWDRMVITRMSSKRRSSVPDTREERGSAEAAAAAEPRSTTLPRSATALSAAADNELLDLDLELSGGAGSSPSISASTAGVKKSLSLLLGHSGTNNSTSESSLNTSADTPVRSARYRPPGFRGTGGTGTPVPQHQQYHHQYEMSPTATPIAMSVRSGQRAPATPQRAPSAPRLGFGELSLTPRSSGSAASFCSRRNVRSMLAGMFFFYYCFSIETRKVIDGKSKVIYRFETKRLLFHAIGYRNSIMPFNKSIKKHTLTAKCCGIHCLSA